MRIAAPERALWLARHWIGAVLAGARVICGIRIVVTGRENLPDGPALLASQHQSAFDTLVWLTIVPLPSYVFKAELARIPLFGPMLVPAGQIPLDRGAGFAAIKGLLRGAERAVAAGTADRDIPGGHAGGAGRGGRVAAWRRGLGGAHGLPVIPVATDSGVRWGRRAFRKTPGPIHIVIGKPLLGVHGQAAVLGALRQAWAAGQAEIAGCG